VKISKRQLQQIIREEKKQLNEYSDYASHADLSDHMDDMFGMMEDVMLKYVDSGWLAAQDQASLAKNLEDLSDDMVKLNYTFNQLAGSGKR
jgi:flagellar biosynthesis/type III secretory pathway chaperone